MSRKFKDLSTQDFKKLPKLSSDHVMIGEERIFLHLYNRKNMNWYLAEYGPISQKFFGFFEDKANGLFSGNCTKEDILKYSGRGDQWEPMVDESWQPVEAKEIEKLKAYIAIMKCPPDW
ncbi:MAG: hypothetical protein HPY61_10220 [Methanotrichaceae archaeon]|nr:hypothetical protein [Methanotrichaceae archaeon]